MNLNLLTFLYRYYLSEKIKLELQDLMGAMMILLLL